MAHSGRERDWEWEQDVMFTLHRDWDWERDLEIFYMQLKSITKYHQEIFQVLKNG